MPCPGIPPSSHHQKWGTYYNFSTEESTPDRSKRYRSKLFAVTAANWMNLVRDRKVTLGAQGSIQSLHWLIGLTENWSGPISIGLFVPGIEYGISWVYLSYLRMCVPSIGNQVSTYDKLSY